MKDKIDIDFRDSYWQLYESYIEYNKTAWTEASYKSETSRLKKIVHIMKTESGLSGNEFHRALIDRGYGAYTIKTMLIRAASFYEFGLRRAVFKGQTNPFKDEMHRSRSLMNGAYRRERLKVDYDTVKEKLESIEEADVRMFCLSMLRSGVRIDEAYKINHETNTVIGKGRKERKVFGFTYKEIPPPSEHRVRKALANLGLKPHTLRKVLSTKLARSGLTHADIMLIFGWKSISTAESYFQSLREDKLNQALEEALR